MKLEGEHNLPETASPEPSWAPLVERIRCGDSAAIEELYAVFAKGIRFFLWRQLGLQDLDDRVHDIFLMVIQSIQRGEVREPERLMGYVRTVVRRQTAGYIQGAVNFRRSYVTIDSSSPLCAREPDPERRAIEDQQTEVAMRVLKGLPKRDREVLVRFYLQDSCRSRSAGISVSPRPSSASLSPAPSPVMGNSANGASRSDRFFLRANLGLREILQCSLVNKSTITGQNV
jgi:DNA-directed RNA polymerase specialized sigma24 family protein